MMEWNDIETAPRDGTPVRIKADDGSIKKPMVFHPPYWWDAPGGIIRLADANLFPEAETTKATHWREIT